jgi:heme A synthase
LFPPSSLAAGLAQDFAKGAHIFVRLRAVHPFLAVVTAAAIVIATGWARLVRPIRAVDAFSRTAGGLVVAQVAIGLLDVATRAPVIMQLAHVVLADAVWIALVLTTAAILSEEPSDPPGDAPAWQPVRRRKSGSPA